jgi:hypothetical protein
MQQFCEKDKKSAVGQNCAQRLGKADYAVM